MAGLKKVTVVVLLLQGLFMSVYTDRPCRPLQLAENRSSVCVCTSDYCDKVERDNPVFGQFITYTSSEAGLRLEKGVENLETFAFNADAELGCVAQGGCLPALYLDTRTLYQTVEGFGGAVTDAAGINWNSLQDEKLKQRLIDAYFSASGLQYNMLRVPIGGSDFSERAYAYNELPKHDAKLSNFSLSAEDFELKLPMIKKCLEAAKTDVHVVASTWSPPGWMKTNGELSGFSLLLPEYYQTYADYHIKFLEEYEKQGVPVWALTTTNEPTNGVMNRIVTFNSLGWIFSDQGRWIAHNLGPTIRNSTFKHVKILAVDDQRNHLTTYYTLIGMDTPEVYDFIDGVASHFYLDDLVAPEMITETMKLHPDKFIISTEACVGSMKPVHVDLGSWERAQYYITNILQNLNYNSTGWIDWNLVLDTQGGPNWVGNFVDAPIIVADDKQKFYKQPMYYAMGHASKFIPRGSKRVKVHNLCENTVENVAFVTPDNTIVTVLQNTGEETLVYLVTCNRLAKVSLPKNSIVTVEFLSENCQDS